MEHCKPTPTRVPTSTKLSKDDEGSHVNPIQYKTLVDNLMYLIATRTYIMRGISQILDLWSLLKTHIGKLEK